MFLFQKGSPLLEDFNYLIGMRYQMGFSLESELDNHLPNATKCLTWHDVKQSHMTKDQNVVVKLDDIYGMIILLTVGLGLGVMIMIMELFSKALLKKIKSVQTQAGKCLDCYLQSGAAGCVKGFARYFLIVPQAVGMNCICHAAQASKGNFQKTCYKTFSTNCRPRLYQIHIYILIL